MKWATVGVCCALGLSAAAYARFVEPRRPRLTRRVVDIAGLPAGLDGLTILHVSDLHVRGFDGVLATFLETLSHLKVDMVAITGDLTESESGAGACAEMLGMLNGSHGVYAVMGNHDRSYYPGWRALLGDFGFQQRRSTRVICEALERSNIKVLTNESCRLEINGETVHVAGIDDMFTKADDLIKASDSIDGVGTRILLSHSPDVLDEAAARGFHLVLSGHTHGGQVRLPIIGALTTHTTKPLRPASGTLYRNSTAMHVSQGLGTTGLPIRFLCPPEATLLRLQAR